MFPRFSSPPSRENKAAFIKDLLEDHYTRFVQMYPKPSLIPRMHYMIHYPRTMLRYVGLDQNSSHPLYKLYISSAISYKLKSWF